MLCIAWVDTAVAHSARRCTFRLTSLVRQILHREARCRISRVSILFRCVTFGRNVQRAVKIRMSWVSLTQNVERAFRSRVRARPRHVTNPEKVLIRCVTFARNVQRAVRIRMCWVALAQGVDQAFKSRVHARLGSVMDRVKRWQMLVCMSDDRRLEHSLGAVWLSAHTYSLVRRAGKARPFSITVRCADVGEITCGVCAHDKVQDVMEHALGRMAFSFPGPCTLRRTLIASRDVKQIIQDVRRPSKRSVWCCTKKGTPLQVDQTLADCGICAGTTLLMHVKARGGMIEVTHASDAVVPESVEEGSESGHAVPFGGEPKPGSRENAETLALPVETTPGDHGCQEGAAYSKRDDPSGVPGKAGNMLNSSALRSRNEEENATCCLFLSAAQEGSTVGPKNRCSLDFRDAFSCLPSVVTWALTPRQMRQSHLPEAGGSGTAFIELVPGREIVLNGGEGIVLGTFFTLDTRILAPIPEGDICRGRARSIRRDFSTPESTSLLKTVASDAFGLGDKVVLSSDYKEHADAKKGPLGVKVVGQVVGTDLSRNVRQ